MKKIIILLLSIISLNAIAQKGVPSEINKVKVYRQTAEITREASVKLAAGTQEVILTGIATYINPASLQVQFNNKNCTLLSAKYERNYLVEKAINPKIEDLKSQLEKVQDEMALFQDKIQSLDGMEAILNNNQSLGGKSGFTPAQVIALADAYQSKLLSIRKEKREVMAQSKEMKKRQDKLTNQLIELNARFNRPSGNIVLQVASKSATTLKIVSTYSVSNAGWYPLYDLRSEGITQNVQLNYKANVYQNTGQDWENVDVVISTGNTTQNNNRPILNPLYADIYARYQRYNENRLNKSKKKEIFISEPVQAEYDEEMVEDDMYGAFNFNAEMGENQLNVEFTVGNKQTILSDGKENQLALQSYDIHTDYVYHTVPKLNNGAFLLAKITDWSQYNLVAGEANIFFEGGFVGKTMINPMVTSDTLLVSMGRDNGIIVERKPIEEFTATKYIGSNKKQTVGYEISVKNKKSIPITIEILDQIPVSTSSEIEITLDEKDGAELLKEIGQLKWTSEVSRGKTIKRKFVYTAKYPKKQSVYGVE